MPGSFEGLGTINIPHLKLLINNFGYVTLLDDMWGPISQNANAQGSFIIESQRFYYTSDNSYDLVLKELAPFIKEQGVAYISFYILENEPTPHIRMAFLNKDFENIKIT